MEGSAPIKRESSLQHNTLKEGTRCDAMALKTRRKAMRMKELYIHFY